MTRSKSKKGAIPYQFVPLPKLVLTSAEWQALPSAARALMIDLMSQYTGRNNGRLCSSYEVLKRSGWRSKTTLINAKRELLTCPFVMLTRKGHPPRTAEWIGFTWWQLDWHQSMDVNPTSWPYLNFMPIAQARADPNVGRGEMSRVVQKRDR